MVKKKKEKERVVSGTEVENKHIFKRSNSESSLKHSPNALKRDPGKLDKNEMPLGLGPKIEGSSVTCLGKGRFS